MIHIPVPINIKGVKTAELVEPVDVTGNVDVKVDPAAPDVSVDVDIHVVEPRTGKVYTATNVSVKVNQANVTSLVMALGDPRTWIFDLVPPELKIQIGALVRIDLQLADDGTGGTGTGPGTGPGTGTGTGATLLTPGTRVTLRASNVPGMVVRHQLLEVKLTTNDGGDLTKSDATFIVHKGLAGVKDSISFESVNLRGHFIRHWLFLLFLHRNDGTALFHKDATFTFTTPGLSGSSDAVTFKAVNYDQVVRHSLLRLRISPNDGKDPLLKDASFLVGPGLKI